ncbi:MAG: response regulator [Opitutales bacterium]
MPETSPKSVQPDAIAETALPKIFLVDDDRATRTLIHNVLKANKFEVHEASSGEEALQILEALQPDLILLDVLMDGMDGFEACPAIKALPNLADVPIIFLTGRSDTKAILEGFRAGASDYITKPFRPPEALARIRTHLQVRSLISQQRLTLEELDRKNRAINKMVSIVSHDLKNPISAIRGLAEFLESGSFGEMNEDQSEMVRSIHSAADAMFGLVKDLLDVSLMDNNSMSLEVVEVDFQRIVTDAINLHKVNAEKKRITLNYAGLTEPHTLACDRVQARRVLDNLITNALKFSPSGTTVRVELLKETTHLLLNVCDQGPGVPEAEKCNLFKHLGRTSNKPTGGEQSTGLGLAICKKIVEAHGGSIGFENQAEGGARFFATFPIAPPKGFYAREDGPELEASSEDAKRREEAIDRMTHTRSPFKARAQSEGSAESATREDARTGESAGTPAA